MAYNKRISLKWLILFMNMFNNVPMYLATPINEGKAILKYIQKI